MTLTENFRFFSIIDRNVRYALYKTHSIELVHYSGAKTLIEPDVDETKFVYMVVRGSVNEQKYNSETKLMSDVAMYRPGEVFGDASI